MEDGKSADVIIIGAGLTRRSLAYFLRDKNIKILLLEARKRPGGRIHTLYNDGMPPREMGATWLGKKHQNNGHQLLREPLYNNRFFIAGSETATDHPGYMDGAVSSARFVADQILQHA